ncbi:hypothetical protein [Deinococcus aluminii]|uniref:Uncharacterized protein n=1 Tax=Deinococcus aluminii TaxID=1656885 RepID=A0ABP9XFV0_9DEIO
MSGSKAGETHEYHGALEVTSEHIKLSPRADNLEIRRRILWDFVSLEAKEHPWHTVGLPLHPEPRHIMDAVTSSVLDRLKEDGGDKDHWALASWTSGERPFDGAFYAIGITPIPDNPYHFRLCDIQLLAVHKEGGWQDLSGSHVTDQERRQATRTALEGIRTCHQDTLRRAERRR